MVFDPYYLKPVSYTGTHYFDQMMNLDQEMMKRLIDKEKSLKGMITTEEFKKLVLDVNADAQIIGDVID